VTGWQLQLWRRLSQLPQLGDEAAPRFWAFRKRWNLDFRYSGSNAAENLFCRRTGHGFSGCCGLKVSGRCYCRHCFYVDLTKQRMKGLDIWMNRFRLNRSCPVPDPSRIRAPIRSALTGPLCRSPANKKSVANSVLRLPQQWSFCVCECYQLLELL